jgi:hypothetical protein
MGLARPSDMVERTTTSLPAAACKSPRDRLAWDTHLLEVYLTGLQSEVEAKVRRVARFREQMRKIDAAGRTTDLFARRKAVDALLTQIDEMLHTNLIVRGTLRELRAVARAIRDDVAALDRGRGRRRERTPASAACSPADTR